MNSFRQNYGLRWQRERLQLSDIRDHLRTAGQLVFILGAFALAGTIDYAEEQRTEAARQAQAAERATLALADCLNGKLRLVSEDGTTAVLCDRAYEIKHERY